MSTQQLVVGEESEVSRVSFNEERSGYVADQEEDNSQAPNITYILESDVGYSEPSDSMRKSALDIVKHLANALLADVLRLAVMVLTGPAKFPKYCVGCIREKACSNFKLTIDFLCENVPFVAHGMYLLSMALKTYERSVRGHLKYVRRVSRQSEFASRRSLDIAFMSTAAGDVDESTVSEPHAKQRRVDSPSNSESVVYRVYRWFTGPVTPENYRFATEETLEELLHKAEVESYHSSQDPDYEPHTESDDTFSSYASDEACEILEEIQEIGSVDGEDANLPEPQRPYHETNM